MAYESSGLGFVFSSGSSPIASLAARMAAISAAKANPTLSTPTAPAPVSNIGTRSEGWAPPASQPSSIPANFLAAQAAGREYVAAQAQPPAQAQAQPAVAEIVWPDPIMPARKFPSLARMMRSPIVHQKSVSLSGIDDGSGSSNTAYYVMGGIAVVALGTYLYKRNKKAKR